MSKVARPRFNSTEAALRFYFRAREFLGDSCDGALKIPTVTESGIPSLDRTFWEFAAIGSSLARLGEFENWLLCELYGPTCFSARQRTIGRALREARIRYPESSFSRRQIERVRRETLTGLRRRLALIGLISAPAGSCSPAAAGYPERASAR